MKGGRMAWFGLALCGLLLAAAGSFGASAGPERGDAGAFLPKAPRGEDGTFHNLDPGFHRASNWTRVRFYLLSLATITSSATASMRGRLMTNITMAAASISRTRTRSRFIKFL